MFFNLGAGGGAFIVRKGMDSNLILGTHIVADGSLARTAGVEIGARQGLSPPTTSTRATTRCV